jgi:hypothetical protein
VKFRSLTCPADGGGPQDSAVRRTRIYIYIYIEVLELAQSCRQGRAHGDGLQESAGPQDSDIYIYIEVLKLAQVLELAQDTYIYIYIYY